MNNNEPWLLKWRGPFIFAVSVITFYQIMLYLPVVFFWVQNFALALSPFVVGASIAYILNIPCKQINNILKKFNIKYSRAISIILTFALCIFIVYLVFNAVIPIITNQIVDLARVLHALYDRITREPEYLLFYQVYVQPYFEELFPDFDLRNFLSASTVINSLADNLMLSIRSVIGLSSSLFTLFISVVSSIYFLIFSETILKFFARLVRAFTPIKICNVLFKYGGQLNSYFYQYIYCQIIDGIILGTAVAVGLTLLGIDYAILFGVLLGVLNIIPYFGSIFGTLFTIIVIMFSNGFTVGLTSSIFLLITQQLDANVVQPKLLGDSFKLNPLFVISSISVGGFYYGILGMIIALPLGAVLRNIVVDLMEYEERKRVLNRQ